jgi:hypothetical protein
MSNMTAGMSPETAFQMAINKRAWPIMTELIWQSAALFAGRWIFYDMKAHSLIPHLLRSIDESHLSRAEMFRLFCYDLIAFKQGVSFASGKHFSGCGLLVWVSSFYAFPSCGGLPQHPILSYTPDLAERKVVFSFPKVETPACIPYFSFGADGTTDKVTIRRFSLADREIDGWRSCHSARI